MACSVNAGWGELDDSIQFSMSLLIFYFILSTIDSRMLKSSPVNAGLSV